MYAKCSHNGCHLHALISANGLLFLVVCTIWTFISDQFSDTKHVGHMNTVKLVLSGHSKIDKTKVLKTNGSLKKVESIAECSLGACCNTFDLH